MHSLVALLALVAGCAGMSESPRGEPMPAVSTAADARLAETPSVVDVDLDLDPDLDVEFDVEAAPVVVSPPADEEFPAATGPLPPTLAPAELAPAAVPVPVARVPPRKQVDPVAAIAPVAASLDVAALKARLRDTAAIGVFAKISLSNQMDELVESFRAYYDGGQNTSLAALRKPYDELVMKVLDLLQEGDPSLARSILSSREAIWGILADRERFSSMH
jgi:hypothetical protein